MKSTRVLYFLLILITIPLGLGTRRYAEQLPLIIAEYGGDVLAATCIFFGVRFINTKARLLKISLISYFICVLIELLQLVRWAPLVKLRDDTPAGIILGHGFLWSDFVCYAVGVLIAFCIGMILERIISNRWHR